MQVCGKIADNRDHECHGQKLLTSLHAFHYSAVVSMQLMLQLLMQVDLDHLLQELKHLVHWHQVADSPSGPHVTHQH